MESRNELIRFGREALWLSEFVSIELSPLTGRGSDRTFFRLKWNGMNSAILVHYDPRRTENRYYADIATFFRDNDIPGPRLIRHDPERCLILMEDLGETDLWSFREASWEIRRDLYQKTLIIAHKLHSFAEKEFPSNSVRLMEDFGPDLYRWEQDYFMNYFVSDVCGIGLDSRFKQELEAELSGLAAGLMETIHCLVHRDLQSRNVMIRDGRPFLIDFQGMRFGSPFYDLGSLLCDPYVEFDSHQRMDLLLHYYRLSGQTLNWEDFQKMFWEASAQRLMQALGAYGFLGLKKGLSTFLDHIPAGLHNLHRAASQVASLPLLRRLSKECRTKIEQKG